MKTSNINLFGSEIPVKLSPRNIRIFWEKTDKKGPDECWKWLGAVNPKGYGRMSVGNLPRRAHRISWQIHFGDIPHGKLVCHRCDTPGCVNPRHLFLGTPKENSNDRDRKGRARDTRGEKSSMAVFTESQIIEMRSLYNSGVRQRDLAKMYGRPQGTINNIVRGINWKHLLPQNAIPAIPAIEPKFIPPPEP